MFQTVFNRHFYALSGCNNYTTRHGTGSAINNSPSICSAPCHGSPVSGGPDAAPSPAPVVQFPAKKPKARKAAGRKHRRKRGRGRPKRKAQTLTSRYLRRHQPERLRRTEVQKLIRADLFATRTGRALITFITIRWALTAERETNINKRWSDLLNAFRGWASRHGIEWAAIGVHENPPSQAPSFNSHILASIPESLRVAATEWLVKQLGGSAGAVHSRPRVCQGKADETVSYMCKGTDYLTAKRFNLIRKQGWKFNQGIVPFRRCTVSQNIGTAAIAAWKSGTIKTGRGEFSNQYTRARKAA